MRFRDLIYALALVGTVLLAGCAGSGSSNAAAGGGGGTGGGSILGATAPAPGGTPISNADLAAVLTTVTAQEQTLVNAGGDRTTRNLQIAAYLKSLPAFKSTGIREDGTVWGILKDNSLYVFNDTFTDITSASANPKTVAAPPKAFTAQIQTTRATASWDLPETQDVLLMHGVDGTADQTLSTMRKDLIARGYSPVIKQADLEALKNVSGNAFFYLVTHGDAVQDQNGTAQWALFSDTPVTEANAAVYAGDRADGSVVIMTAAQTWNSHGVPQYSTNFAITYTFIKKYGWSFPKHSTAFLNACNSDSYSMCPDLFTLDNPPGASYGYNNTAGVSTSLDTSAVFADCVTGLYTTRHLEPGRPFDDLTAWSAMRSYGYSGGTNTTWVRRSKTGADSTLFAPSIGRMTMVERLTEDPNTGTTKLVLNGEFGKTKPVVKIGGVDVPVLTFAKDKLEINPAEQPGPGFSGQVVVSLNQVLGNSVPLTMWSGTADYDIDAIPQQAADIHFNHHMVVTYRGDIHPVRDLPMQSSAAASDWQPSSVMVRPAQLSTGKWKFTGTPIQGTTWTTFNGTSPYGLNGTADAPYGRGFILDGTFDVKNGQFNFGFNYLNGVLVYATQVQSFSLASLRDNTLVANTNGQRDPYGALIYARLLSTSLAADGTVSGKTFAGTLPSLNPKFTLSSLVPDVPADESKAEDWSQGN